MVSQDVATAFVSQYYTVLNQFPQDAHKFYRESSVLSWPSSNGGVMTSLTTLSGINKKILSSFYNGLAVEIKTIDSQDSYDGGIIVVVTGSFIGEDKATSDFSQTFFLAKQEKGFFVLNDILRISDSPTPSSSTKAAVENCNCNGESVAKGPTSNGHLPSVVELTLNAQVSFVAVPAASSGVPSDAKPSSNGNGVVAVVTPPSNVSYASMVSKSVEVTSPKAVSVTPEAPKPSILPTKVSPADGNSMPDTTQTRSESRAVFVGDLPSDVTKLGVVEAMEQFGPVRRYSDSVQIRKYEDGYCCAFVDFESVDSARRAVEAEYVKFGERKAYIE